MDPRYPEQALARMTELMTQFVEVEKNMLKATTSAALAELEREGSLVVQEICLVSPRLHEAMMQTSRQRRHDLAHGVVIDMSKYRVPDGASGEEVGVVEEPMIDKADVIGEENIGGESGPAHKWSSAEKVAEAKDRLEQAIADSDVEKPVEKPQEKCVNDPPKQSEKCDETEVKPVKSKAKKTTKKAKK